MKELDLKAAKTYLRVDGDEEDEFIEDLIGYSKEMIRDATGVKECNCYTYKLAQLLIITDRFECRGSGDQEFKAHSALNSMFTKLKFGGGSHEDTGK